MAGGQVMRRLGGRRGRGEQGFTLIELLIVVIILGILTGVVVFSVGGLSEDGLASAVAADARTLRSAQEAHYAQEACYASSQEELVAKGYLREVSTYNQLLGPGPDGRPTCDSYAVGLADEQQTLTVAASIAGYGNGRRLARFSLDAGTCETLLRLRNDYTVGPRLATRYEYMGDNTFRFYLRDDVWFHDGQKFNAAAVKYSLDRLVALGDDFTAFLGPDSTTVVDEYIVDVRPVGQNLRLPEILVHPTYGIIAPGTEPENPRNEVVCTGPFRMVEYVANNRLRVERFDGYWGPRPRLREITYRFIPDATTRLLALRNGEVDAIFDVPRQQAGVVRNDRSLRLVTAGTSYVFNLYMNVNGDPPYDILRSRNVRRALALSIDRNDFIARSYEEGMASLVNTPSPPSILGPFASLIAGNQFNLTQARQLLDDEGWVEPSPGAVRRKDGRDLELELLWGANDETELLQDIQSRARQVGIQIVLKTPRQPDKNNGLWDLDNTLPNQNDANPAFLLTLQWYSGSRNPWIRWQQAGPAFDELVELGQSSPDIEVARDYAARAMRLLIDEEAMVIPLAGLSRSYGLRQGIQGFNPHPAQSHTTWEQVYRTQ